MAEGIQTVKPCPDGVPRAECVDAERNDTPSVDNKPPAKWPRDHQYRHYYEHHLEKRYERDRFGIVLRAPFATLSSGSGRHLGIGGDVIIPFPWSDTFNLGLGYISYPFKQVGNTGHRMSLFLDFPRISCYARFRLGAYAEMPEFGDIGVNYELVEGGLMSEILLTLFRYGHLRAGAGVMATFGGSARGLRLSAGGGPTIEFHF